MRRIGMFMAGAAAVALVPTPASAQLIGIDLSLVLVDLDARVTLQGGQITVLDGRVIGTEAALAQLQALYATSAQQIAAQQAATTSLVSGATANAAAIVNLDGRIDGAIDAIASVGADVSVLGGRVASVETAVDANASALVDLDAASRVQGAALIDIRADVAANATITAGHEVRLGVHEQRLDTHEARLDGHDVRLDTHQAVLVEHGARLDGHDVRLGQHDIILAEHGGRLDSHDVRIDAAAANAAAAGAHSATLRADVEQGRVGLVQQTSPSAAITVGAQTGGTVVDFTGTDGARRLTGIAPGLTATDAANMGQVAAIAGETLRSANAYTDASVSMALDRAMDATAGMMQANNRRLNADMNAVAANGAALSGLPQSFIPGRGMAGASMGGHGGEVSLALGISKATASERPTVFKAGAAVDTRRGEVSYNAGVGFHF